MNAIVLARLLGWFSLGLGTLEVVAPSTLSRNLGLPGGGALVRAFGLRELVAGAAIFGQPSSPMGPWSRVAGDAMDIAVLGWAARPGNRKRGMAAGALALVVGVTAVDLLCAAALTRRGTRALETARRTRIASHA